MEEKLIYNYYNMLIRKLSNSRWIEKWNLNKDILSKIKSKEFYTNFYNMMKNNDFSCVSTFNLFKDLLYSLTPNLPEDFMSYIYQYTLKKAFPESVTIHTKNEHKGCCELYLKALNLIALAEENSKIGFKGLHPLIFLKEEEILSLEYSDEYKKFIKGFNNDNIYLLMKLSDEKFNFNTLDHVSGVHFLSIYIGRQLKSNDVNIDLGRVSGAAAGHDIGKYGCKENELKRVPRLHYYYTDMWFKKHGINYIRNIAINHSTWDLELENLSLESLVLIYCDFRVKNEFKNGIQKMKIFDLEESFFVILEKLENLDDKKLHRYKKVYSKLKDFEDYLINLGISIDPYCSENCYKKQNKNHSLLMGKEIVENIKFLSIKHNLNLMYELRDEFSLEAILEAARSEKDWRNLREYIRILQEYSTYLTQKQKLQTIKFLYENLIHPEDDIRRHCAELLGHLIAIFDEKYRKELPDNVELEHNSTSSLDLLECYTQLLLYPSYKFVSIHKFYLNYSFSIMINSFFYFLKNKESKNYLLKLMSYFDEKNIKNTESQLSLLEAIKSIPFKGISDIGYEEKILNYLLSAFKKKSSLRLSALDVILYLLKEKLLSNNSILLLKQFFTRINSKSKIPGENLLLLKTSEELKIEEAIAVYKKYCNLSVKDTSEIFISNLRTNIDWVRKRNHVDLLLHYALQEPKTKGLHSVIHFCNLMKVSPVESVRSKAGYSILQIIPYLNFEERNEVAIELLRALEIEGNKFTEYIPFYAGQVLLWLRPKELDEVLEDLKYKVKTSNLNLKALILKTVGIILSHYNEYKLKFNEKPANYDNRLIKLLGILLNGIGSPYPEVNRAAFTVIGKDIFGTKLLSFFEKEKIFKLISKKLLSLITETNNEELLFLSKSAGLNHIYRFISEFSLIGDINIEVPKKIAFFPGTFDPFSLSHKEIAKYIRNSGYEVYLAVDEFSWSKRTLPSLLRRNILNMSISDELDIYIYPDNLPVNISNNKDLTELRESFKESDVYIAVGSDVVLNASAYKLEKALNSIHTFNHIIFDRTKNKTLAEYLNFIDGKIEIFNLSPKFSDISSTQIRNYIDGNKDISSLVDPMAHEYIYQNGFYQKESQEKTLAKISNITTELHEDITDDLIEKLCSSTSIGSLRLKVVLNNFRTKASSKILLLKNSYDEEILGFSFFHWIRSKDFYNELKDSKSAEAVRLNSIGRIILINGIYIINSEKTKYYTQILLTETLALCISKDYEYAIYKDTYKKFSTSYVFELLKLYGFKELPSEKQTHIYSVDMSNPCILNLDMEVYLKAPFRGNNSLKQKIIDTRKKLMEVLTLLYPNNLVLPFHSSFINESMIKRVCMENEVPIEPTTPRVLGKNMCVPYGDILDRYVIPNTVTKSLHIEKFFQPDMKKFSIKEFPHYLDVKTQVKMLKSFNKPIILAATLLHKGYRLKALDQVLKEEKVEVKKIICGILSGHGKDLMDYQNREVDSIYFIPKLNLWFNESELYPFIGGDAVWRGSFPERNLLPSINLLLPYTSPAFIRNSNKSAIYNLSKVCIENSIEIFSCLEELFHRMYEKNLNLSSLGIVFTVPRCPEKGKGINYDLNNTPTYYLKNDLEKLIRLENIIKY